MKCLECYKEMKLLGKEKYFLSNDTDACSFLNEYECPDCGIKVFFDMGIDTHGIKKLYLPENFKPTVKQLELVDYIVTVMPETKYVREKCYTKKQISKFIGKYKETAFKVNKRQNEEASKMVSETIAKTRNVKKK